MSRLGLGDVIASRRLTSLGDDARRITVRVGRPRRVQAGEWACPVEFTGLAEIGQIAGRGVDSCQALLNAFDGIHYTLAQSGLRFTWSALENETGFPRSVPYGFGPDFAAGINRHIDRQINR